MIPILPIASSACTDLVFTLIARGWTISTVFQFDYAFIGKVLSIAHTVIDIRVVGAVGGAWLACLGIEGGVSHAYALYDVHVGACSARDALLGAAQVDVICAFSIAVGRVPVPARVTVFAFLAYGIFAKLDDGVVGVTTIASVGVLVELACKEDETESSVCFSGSIFDSNKSDFYRTWMDRTCHLGMICKGCKSCRT